MNGNSQNGITRSDIMLVLAIGKVINGKAVITKVSERKEKKMSGKWHDGWRWNDRAPFEELLGKTITNIEGLEKGSENVLFECSDGSRYEMYHEQD